MRTIKEIPNKIPEEILKKIPQGNPEGNFKGNSKKYLEAIPKQISNPNEISI